VRGGVAEVIVEVVDAYAEDLLQARVRLLAVLGHDEAQPDAADPRQDRVVGEVGDVAAGGADVGAAVDEVDGHRGLATIWARSSGHPSEPPAIMDLTCEHRFSLARDRSCSAMPLSRVRPTCQPRATARTMTPRSNTCFR